ncbi:MAG: acetyl-CoA carboxylase biotin carboxyl carrier protein [Clostridiales bacterium]|nr:acetyl-CoA carboxylase biotin carboxyl carrier protein [Clostridiales bacterium]
MEYEQLIKLIKTVSGSSLSSFQMENDGVKISMKKNMITSENVQKMPMPAAADGQMIGEEEKIPEGNMVKAPLVGTFYTSSAPGEQCFVKVGDTVKKGQVLGIIEAMKLMNEIESEYDGVVEAVLAENEQMVEYGQPLFVIRS